MVAVHGYYDGSAIRIPEEIMIRKNQKLIITVLDEFTEPDGARPAAVSLKGSLGRYANPALWEQEKSAWEFTVNDT